MPAPCPFDPAAERPRKGERAATAAIQRSLRSILDTTWADYGHAVRSVHAKSHALLEGTLTIGHLPPPLAQGLFATPGDYPAILRISTNPGDVLDDAVSAPRGAALKLIGIQGPRLPGAEPAPTQDILMANTPAFAAPDPAGFARSLRLLAATTDTGQWWKKALSATLRTLVRTRLLGPGAKGLGGQPVTHPLGETFYSQTPFRYGDHVAKFCLAPVSPGLLALRDAPLRHPSRPNALRQAAIEQQGAEPSAWELRVQLRTNPATMPIEDAATPWPEDESPYVMVARFSVPRQPAWSEARARQVDDALAFSPWNGLLAHQPLGGINRARKPAYPLSATFRATHNACPIHAPQSRLPLSLAAASTYGTTKGREGRRPRTPDARPGALGAPLRPTLRKVSAGALGGTAAGLLTSAILVALEQATASPSELATLQRGATRRLGRPAPLGPIGASEQLQAHAGHLLLSAATGAAFELARPRSIPAAASGAAMGAGFYGLAFGAIGPALGLTPKLSDDEAPNIVRHLLVHLAFGVTTALAAEQLSRRL